MISIHAPRAGSDNPNMLVLGLMYQKCNYHTCRRQNHEKYAEETASDAHIGQLPQSPYVNA